MLSLCESILQDLKSNNNVKQRASSLLKHLSTHRLYRRTRKSAAKRKVLGEQKFQRGSIYFNTCAEISVPGGPNISKYKDRGEHFWGVQIFRDRPTTLDYLCMNSRAKDYTIIRMQSL